MKGLATLGSIKSHIRIGVLRQTEKARICLLWITQRKYKNTLWNMSHFILNTFSKSEEPDIFYPYSFLVSCNSVVNCNCSRNKLFCFSCLFIPSIGTIQMKQLEILERGDSLAINQHIYWSSKYFALCKIEKTFSTSEELVI